MGKQYKGITISEQGLGNTNSVSISANEQSELSITDKCILIDKLAKKAFDTFYDKMLVLYGLNWPSNIYYQNKYWKRFLEVGELLYDNEWDPEDYVDTVLSDISKNHLSITPKDLVNKNAISSYKLKSNTLIDPKQEWAFYIMQLVQYEKTADATENKLLESPITPFPAWFRLAYPEELSETLINNWSNVGCTEITKNKKLKEFLESVVPNRMQQLSLMWGENK